MLMRLPFIILLLLPASVLAQSRKELKKNDVKTLTELVVVHESGKDQSHRDSFQRFDKHGEVIEEIEYDKTGKLNGRKTFRYNKEHDKVEEQNFDAVGKLKGKTLIHYDNLGQKTEELHYNDQQVLVSRSIYTYNVNGLRKQKLNYNGSGQLVQTRQYQYEY